MDVLGWALTPGHLLALAGLCVEVYSIIRGPRLLIIAGMVMIFVGGVVLA